MNKPLKITLISIGATVAVLAVAIAVLVNAVFSRERLTAWVQQHADDYVTCPLDIDQVELTFFSTFPDFCFHISDISLLNPMEGAINDTLLHVHDLYASIDVIDYLDNNKISVTAFNLQKGRVNVYVDEEGNNNYEVCPLLFDSSESDSTAMLLDKVKLEGISIADFSGSFLDRKHDLEARVAGLDAVLETDADFMKLSGNADLTVTADEVFYSDSLNFAQIQDFAFSNCKLWSDGSNATLKLDQLRAASQEYLLSGDMALMAHIWNFNLHDIDLAWQDGKPKVDVLTALDSAIVTMGADDLTYITVGPTAINAPVSSTDSLWTARVFTSMNHLSVSMDSEGSLIDNRDLETRFMTSTNTAFNDFHVWEMSTTLGTQTVKGDAHVNMADSTDIVGNLALSLSPTRLSELLDMVPASYRAPLSGMDLGGTIAQTDLKVDLQVRHDTLILHQVKATGKADDFAYADTANVKAKASDLSFTVLYPNNLRRPYAKVSFSAAQLTASVDDTLQVEAAKPSGQLQVDFENYGSRIKVQSNSQLDELQLAMGKGVAGKTGKASVRLDALYDDRKSDLLEMLSPDVDARVDGGHFDIAGIPYSVDIPGIDFSFSNNLLNVRQSELKLGNSHLRLKGALRNLGDYLADKGQLEGNFDLTGPMVDADQLLDMVSGVGVDSTLVAESGAADSSAVAADPFMVPMGVDVTLHTHVDRIVFGENPYDHVNGDITCRNGVVALDEVGFTNRAATMQLTALYKSPRRNNLFVGWNFHLLDIDIAEMVNLVPQIDTIAPMLKAFAGKAEFHLAGESNLFADYSPKMSTLKAVAAVEGKDLTVLDNETYRTIKKYLFKESTTNKIDSMSVELAVARKKMTLYPMLVSWDRYEAVISGTHTIVNDMPFNYHISITKCPVVGGHLGLDIQGNIDDLDHISFKVGNCKYANLYRPEKRNLTQEQTLELKNLISTSLKKTVK